MSGVARVEREISAQSCPVSGMDRTASRTTPDTIFSGCPASVLRPPSWCLAGKNRARHRRWRGRFAVLDPVRSIPGAPSCLSGSGGNHVSRTANRRTPGRASEHHRHEGIASDRGRVNGGGGRSGKAGYGSGGVAGLTDRRNGRSGAVSTLLLPSCCSRMADLRGFWRFEVDRFRSARLKLDLPREIKSLSAHHYFTRQVGGPARQAAPKLLIELARPRDLLICRQPSEQRRRFPVDLQDYERRQ